jgi:hypothetical protein
LISGISKIRTTSEKHYISLVFNTHTPSVLVSVPAPGAERMDGFHTNNNDYLVVSTELTNNLLRIPSTDAAMNTKIQDTHEETALMVSLGLPFQHSEF